MEVVRDSIETRPPRPRTCRAKTAIGGERLSSAACRWLSARSSSPRRADRRRRATRCENAEELGAGMRRNRAITIRVKVRSRFELREPRQMMFDHHHFFRERAATNAVSKCVCICAATPRERFISRKRHSWSLHAEHFTGLTSATDRALARCGRAANRTSRASAALPRWINVLTFPSDTLIVSAIS